MHIRQLLTLVGMCVYDVYAYFGWVNVVIYTAHICPLPGRLIGNRNEFSKFRFQLMRKRIVNLIFQFRLIRTKIKLRKSGSGFLKSYSVRPLQMETLFQ